MRNQAVYPYNLKHISFLFPCSSTQIYYIVFLTSIGGKLMHGIFNCAVADMEIWREAAFQVIRSIQDTSDKGN